MKFKHKILLSPLLTALAFALLFGITLRASNRSSQTITRIQDEFFHALELSHDLEVDLLTIRHLLTEAVTNGNEDLLEDAIEVADRFRTTIDGCREVPALADQLGPLKVEFDAYFELARLTTLRMLDQNMELDLDFDESLYIDIGQMNSSYAELESHLAQVVDDNNDQLEAAIVKTRDGLIRSRRVMNITSILFLALLVILSIGVSASVLRPVHRMSRVAKSIAGGDLGKELEFDSKDELGELADSFRDMQAALIRDIARREQAEADLISAQGQIIQSEKMAVLGKLVAGLAHELNTPLGTLASAADVTDRSRLIIREKFSVDGEGAADPRLQRALTALDQGVVNMTAASQRIDELVTGLRSFSQLDKAEYQLTDINEGMTATLNLAASQIPEGVEVIRELGEIEPILGYPAQLNQLFLGLIRHAVQDVEAPGTVTVTTAMGEDRVRVTVADTGCGYDKRALAALFNPGFRAETSRVRMDWGLVTCNRIVDRHGGTLNTDSEPGHGTTYRIEIPVRHEAGPEGSAGTV
jgi:signal transduction histidine kinase